MGDSIQGPFNTPYIYRDSLNDDSEILDLDSLIPDQLTFEKEVGVEEWQGKGSIEEREVHSFFTLHRDSLEGASRTLLFSLHAKNPASTSRISEMKESIRCETIEYGQVATAKVLLEEMEVSDHTKERVDEILQEINDRQEQIIDAIVSKLQK